MKSKINKNIGLSFGSKTKGPPSVVFKGVGNQAEALRREFIKHKPMSRVIKDEELVNKLSSVPIQSEISSDLYGLIAILLIHVYSLEKRINNKEN